MSMDNQVLPSQHATPEPMVALAGDLSSGRQLRKSCRFCRSRKIRCSGETDIGCSACRNRNQKCVYEPTAAMGRPRKYPRTELCGNGNASLPANLSSHVPAAMFQRGWSDSRLFMRSLHPQSYGPGELLPPGGIEPIASPVPWGAPNEEDIREASFHIVSSVNTHRNRPAITHLHSLPPTPSPQDMLSTHSHNGDNCAFLDRYLPVSDPGRSILSTATSQHGSTSRAGLQGSVETALHHATFSSQRFSPDLNQMDHLSMNTPEAGSLVTMVSSNSQSSPSLLSNDHDVLLNTHHNTHHAISTFDQATIFQHFQGATLHAITQAHLQFILREYPNPYLSAPHKHPSVLQPKLYHTMLADVVSCMTYARKSTPNRPNSPVQKSQYLFNEMLDFDRGENVFQDATAFMKKGSLAPLEQLNHEELDAIYLQFLRINPFGFLFNDEVPTQQSRHSCEDRALLATIVGWHFFLSFPRSNHEVEAADRDDQQKMNLRAHMPFFEYAEAELMGRTTIVNESTLHTVRGLVLLAAFRSVDSQPRCGWALLSVAHVLTKEYLRTFGGPKDFSRSEFDNQEGKILGLHWLLNLYRSWTLLSMGFPKATVFTVLDSSPSYLDSYLARSRSASANEHSKVNSGWANRVILDASQLLEVFCTLCREDPSTLLLQNATARPIGNDQLGERNLYLIRWLMDTAKMNCKVMGLFDSPPSTATREAYQTDLEISNSNSNMVLAVVFSLFALSRLIPLEEVTSTQFTKIPILAVRDVLKLLHIISSEGINPVVLVTPVSTSNALDEALTLGILRRVFRYMSILLQAFVNTLSDFSRTSASDYHQILSQFLEVIESLEQFVASGLTLYPVEDFQKIQNVRITLGSIPATLTACQQSNTKERNSGSLQVRLPVSGADLAEASHPTKSYVGAPFKIKEEYAEETIQPIPINGYPGESNRLNSHSAPTTASSTDSISTCNNEGHLAYIATSTDVGCLSSSPLICDHNLPIAHLDQKYHHPDQKLDHLTMTSQASGFMFPLSNTHGMMSASEIEGEDSKPNVFGCPRAGQGHYLCALDSPWIPQPSRHQIDLDSNAQPMNFDGFSRSSTLIHQASTPLGSPPSYKHHSHTDYFARNAELREPPAGCFISSDPQGREFRATGLTNGNSSLELGALGSRLDISATSTPCPHAHQNAF